MKKNYFRQIIDNFTLTVGAHARDANGNEVHIDDPAAVAFSLPTAIYKTVPQDEIEAFYALLDGESNVQRFIQVVSLENLEGMLADMADQQDATYDFVEDFFARSSSPEVGMFNMALIIQQLNYELTNAGGTPEAIQNFWQSVAKLGDVSL